MNFFEQTPSNEWALLGPRGEEIAGAWFKPEGEPLTLVFRVPLSRLDVPDLSQIVTVEDLLTAADISAGEIESWQFLDESHLSLGGANLELKRLLPTPPPGETHLTVRVRMQSHAREGFGAEGGEISPKTWQDLDTTWKTILGLEAAIDSLRLGMEGLRSEMEAAFKRSLSPEEKVHALQSDVAQWTKGKNRVHHSTPKVREFVHRAIWALALPERKRLAEIVKSHIEPQIPFPEIDAVRDQLGHLQKDRQVLLAQGNTINQEGRGILSEIQRALSALQRNAADRARQKRSTGRDKGKHL